MFGNEKRMSHESPNNGMRRDAMRRAVATTINVGNETNHES